MDKTDEPTHSSMLMLMKTLLPTHSSMLMLMKTLFSVQPSEWV